MRCLVAAQHAIIDYSDGVVDSTVSRTSAGAERASSSPRRQSISPQSKLRWPPLKSPKPQTGQGAITTLTRSWTNQVPVQTRLLRPAMS